MRRLPIPATFTLALACALLLACGDKSGQGSGGDGDGDGDGDSDTSGTTGGPDSDPVCDMYLECLAKVDPDSAPAEEEKYGPGGSCWTEETAPECVDDCQDKTDEILEDFPNEEVCGGEPLCADACCPKDMPCNADNPCCDGTDCYLVGADSCLCADLPERCNMCMTDCLGNMIMPEICEMSCKVWCMPDHDADPC
jgi:hypothetical protein